MSARSSASFRTNRPSCPRDGARRAAWGAAFALFAAPAIARAEPAEEDARKLYQDATSHYDLAEYDQAIEAFRRAYLLTHAPELLYNIAQSYRLKGPGSCRSALSFYRSFLRVQPETARRAGVEAAIADMEACAVNEPEATTTADEPAAAPASPPPPSTPPAGGAAKGARASTTVPLVLGASGLGLSLVGGGLFTWSRLRYEALSSEGCAPACDPSRTDAPRIAQSLGGVLLSVGGALVVTGVVIWLLHPNEPQRAAALPLPASRWVDGWAF